MKTQETQNMRKGFTLVELLTVIAIIAILAGILIPTISSAINSAKEVDAKAQLQNYVVALKQFKADYGYFPTFFDSSTSVINLDSDSADFIEVLTGYDSSGARSQEFGNRKARSYYEFSDKEFDSNSKIADPFGRTDIFIAVDIDGDGYIESGDIASSVNSSGGDVRGSVVAYIEELDAASAITTWETD